MAVERLPDKGAWWRWMILPLRRYARFHGRSGRREFWWFFLAQTVVYVALVGTVIASILFGIALEEQGSRGAETGWIVLFGGAFLAFAVIYLALFVPTLAVTVRRLHDLGMSGWIALPLYLASWFLSFIGYGIYVVMMALPGQGTENAYGPPVYGDQLAPVFE